MIANIKMEISRIETQAQYGMIPPEQAKMEIAMLESKLSALESGLSVDGVQFEAPTSITPEIDAVKEPQDANNETPNDNNDSEQRQEAFFEQQAIYNRMFHGV